MPYICPDEIPSDKRQYSLRIPNSRLFVGAVIGAIEELTKTYNWEIQSPYSNTTPQQCAEAAQELLSELLEVNCDCIHNLSYNASTGELSFFDASGTRNVIYNQSQITQTNQYYIPPTEIVDSRDVYCYAAQTIAAAMADNLRDALELFDILEELLITSFVNLFNRAVEWAPPLGTIASALGETFNDITEDMYDWLLLNADDIEAVEGAAEIIYCALIDASENEDFDNLNNYIAANAGSELVQFAVSLGSQVAFNLNGAFAVFNVAYSVLDSEKMKFGIIAWLLASDEVANLLGQPSAIRQMIATATRYAIASDGRDCALYPCNTWTKIFNFSDGQQGWQPSSPNPAIWVGDGWTDGIISDPNTTFRVLRLALFLPDPDPTITEVSVTYDYVPATTSTLPKPDCWVEWSGSTLIRFDPTAGNDQTSTVEHTANPYRIRVNFTVGARPKNQPTVDGSVKITKIVLRGTGDNPFI